MAITPRRYWFGATGGEVVTTLGDADELLLAPNATIYAYEAQDETVSDRIVDLQNAVGGAATEAVASALGSVRFKADVDRTQVWVAAPPSIADPNPKRTLMVATDLDDDLDTIDTAVIDHESRIDDLEVGAAPSTDHGTLSGLGDDDHTQYHNDTRGDIRYFTRTLSDGRFVRTVNGVGPDGAGNVAVTGGGGGSVETVNGVEPDGGGNVTLSADSVGAAAVGGAYYAVDKAQNGGVWIDRASIPDVASYVGVIWTGADPNPVDMTTGDLRFKTP